MKTVALLLFASGLAFSVQASAAAVKRTYYCQYHFTDSARDKEVTKVVAHTGVLVKSSNLAEFVAPAWKDVRDVALDHQEKFFVGKAVLSTESEANLLEEMAAPVVQFWVDYADGSSEIFPETQIRLTASIPSSYPGAPELAKSLIEEFDKLEAPYTVACFEIIAP